MSNARKLQTEIDRVLKKVDEGVELFDEIWEKVYSSEQQNQKEKYEMDLKKEIKKLQRLRDQIKTWISSSEVKDKDALLEARKLIETKMEQFKICEKETKTKTYSKEGLAREEKLDPAEEAKLNTTQWMQEFIDRLKDLVEEADFEIEKLSSGKGKKTNKHQIEEYQTHIANHRYHINKLEGIIRLVNNDVLDVELVDSIKDDLDYYGDSFREEEYMQAYEEDFMYESLGLEELDVVNVDHLAQANSQPTKKSSDDAGSYSSSKGSKDVKSKNKAGLSSVIPLTIGRARTGGKSDKKEEEKPTPVKPGRSTSVTATKAETSAPTPAKSPATTPAVPAVHQGASMAAILKRETEQQEKERQKARAQAEQQRLQEQQQAELRQQEALRQQQQAQQEALKRQQQEQLLRQQQEAAAAQQEQLQAQQQLLSEQKLQQQAPAQSLPIGASNSMEILSSGLGGLALGGVESRVDPGGLNLGQSVTGNSNLSGSDGSNSLFVAAIGDSFSAVPNNMDNDRSRQYTPQNPYPTPASYPSTPSSIFENPSVFEKLGTDCLFFIFYYAQGTYQQYLAARELKKQSWRFHKKYMTWFQRHEEPKVTTDEYEQGTYVYFDYETGWCTRIKQDFRFEYSYLEDSLQ